MHQGRPVPKLFFMNSGIVRLYRLHNGMDITLGFVSGHEFVSTAIYVLGGQISPCALETLTPVEALEWDREDLLLFEKKISCSEQIKTVLTERLLEWSHEKEMDAATLLAEERYLKMMEYQPEIIQSVPLRHIASYLGIHQDSLSRIRKKITGKSYL
jgi:CRP-like cAMP-binding protein